MSHTNCETKPCQLCKRRQRGETCGSCHAGILVGVNGNEVHRCDVCALFETDDDAVDATRVLLELLHKVYKKGLKAGDFTVADACDQIRADVLNAPVLRARANRILRHESVRLGSGENGLVVGDEGSHQALIDFARDLREGKS